MRVVDSFDAIRPIMSRFSMLAPLDQDGIRLQVFLPCTSADNELHAPVLGSMSRLASVVFLPCWCQKQIWMSPCQGFSTGFCCHS